MTRFSKDYQPKVRRKPTGNSKEVMSVRVRRATKDWFKRSSVRGGDVLDDYVEQQTKED